METTVLSYLPTLRGLRAARRKYHALPWQTIGKVEQRHALDGCAPHTWPLDLAAMEADGFWEPAEGEPLHMLVGSKVRVSRQSSVRCHVWSKPLPLHALVRARADVYACSPAFAAMLYARGRSLADTFMLLMELLGTYTLPEQAALPIAWGGRWPDDAADEVQQVHYKCEPAVTLRELRDLAKWSTSSLDQGFRTAVNLVAEHSASPMESILYGMLGVRPRFGGLNLCSLPGGMLLNQRIDFEGDALHMASGVPYAICDAYVPAARTDFEYNGSEHDAAERRDHDGRRNNGLKGMGVKVVVISRVQMTDVVALEAVARSAYRDAGARWREGAAGYRKRQYAWLNGLRAGAGLPPA